MLKFLEKTYVPNLFTTKTILCYVLYKIVTYHWKGSNENYNFIVENISIKIHMKKISNIFVL